MAVKRVLYAPDGEVLSDFFQDRSPVSIIQGPIGSGTSTACCFKMWKISCEQKPDGLGVRRTRWVVVRNTYSDLKETTLKTWRYWFEEKAMGALGEVKMTNPPSHHIKWDLSDRTTVDVEFLFLALDQEDDVRKLLSMEPTGFWFNEAQFVQKEIFDTADSRLGRFPPKMDGGPTWYGILADLNAPPEGHWIPYMRGDIPMPEDWSEDQRRAHTRPKKWKFFVQPPGLIEIVENGQVAGYKPNPKAENTKWLEKPYLDQVAGKPKSWVDTYVMNRVGLYRVGQPVYESFRPESHVAKKALDYISNVPLIVGLDFARNPAMVCLQILRNTVYVLDEFGVENQAATTYAPLFRQRLLKKFPRALQKDGPGIQFWGDPTGDAKGQGTDITPYAIFRKNGMMVVPAPGHNSISLRINAVQSQLDKMVDGRPAFLLSPGLLMLKAGFVGGYHFAKIKGTNAHHEEPNKKVRYADFHDALQYACLGAGLGVSVLNPDGNLPRKPKKRKERKRFSLVHR